MWLFLLPPKFFWDLKSSKFLCSTITLLTFSLMSFLELLKKIFLLFFLKLCLSWTSLHYFVPSQDSSIYTWSCKRWDFTFPVAWNNILHWTLSAHKACNLWYRRETLRYKRCQTWHLHNGSCHPIYQYRHIKLDAAVKEEVWLVKVILKSELRWWIQFVTWCSTWEYEHSKREIKLIPWELPV